MNLGQFLKFEKALLVEFGEFYHESRAGADRKNFPETLTLDQWRDQMRLFAATSVQFEPEEEDE